MHQPIKPPTWNSNNSTISSSEDQPTRTLRNSFNHRKRSTPRPSNANYHKLKTADQSEIFSSLFEESTPPTLRWNSISYAVKLISQLSIKLLRTTGNIYASRISRNYLNLRSTRPSQQPSRARNRKTTKSHIVSIDSITSIRNISTLTRIFGLSTRNQTRLPKYVSIRNSRIQ